MKKKTLLKFGIPFCLVVGVLVFLFFPRNYNSFFQKAKLKEAEGIEITFRYDGRDEHEDVIAGKYKNRYWIDNEQTIENIQEVLRSISMKPRYWGSDANIRGLIWDIRIEGQGDYSLNIYNYFRGDGNMVIIVSLGTKKMRTVVDDNTIFPGHYEISEEDNEKIIQALFQALKDNIKDMTAEDALRLSEKNAEWREFMFYYSIDADIYGSNTVYIPIQDTNMQIKINYDRIITEPEYIEPIKEAVLYDEDGNEYEYFSEEGREILRKVAEAQ